MSTTRRLGAVLVAGAFVAGACSSGSSDEAGGQQVTGTTVHVSAPSEPGCEVLDPLNCMLPFPSDQYTRADASTSTGLRVAFPDAGTPTNAEGVRVDTAPWGRNDGFSPGASILASVPGLDPEASKIPGIDDIGSSLDDTSPVVLVDATTGQRAPFWAELDSHTTDDPLLIIRPATALTEGHRYVVALRALVAAGGKPVTVPAAFAAFRDRHPVDAGDVEARRARFEEVFATLEKAGVDRSSLDLAWDFTVASEQSLAGPLLSMRDQAFGDLGDPPADSAGRPAGDPPAGKAPHFEVASVSGDPTSGRTVNGTFEVPNFLTGKGAPGSTLGVDEKGVPQENATFTARFTCTVPPVKEKDGTVELAGASLYGHGLLGGADEVLGIGSVAGGLANVAFCATDWVGMSAGDIGNVGKVLTDLSGFASIPDRLEQAHLNFLYLGRLLRNPSGFASDPAFQTADGKPQLSGEVEFVGNSQGGVLGGAVSSVAQDWTRVVLGVPGMNYSTLLERSVDFDEFAPVYTNAYPDRTDQLLGLAMIQMLWDRGENQGYAQHLTTHPYAGTPAKQVLLFEAFGDHQVANIATETLARTIGAEVRRPALAEGRATAVEPFWGIDGFEGSAETGSYLLVWDFGTPAPPTTNSPPTEGEDPHGKGSDEPAVLTAAAQFLNTGELVDVCNGGPCQSKG